MIDRREILETASSFSLLPNIVEKDYVLGWMLAGINAHDELAERWVFKGGTCLKKCYFETYRFSEDLDFTLRNEEHLNEEFLRTVFDEIIAHQVLELPVELQAFACTRRVRRFDELRHLHDFAVCGINNLQAFNGILSPIFAVHAHSHAAQREATHVAFVTVMPETRKRAIEDFSWLAGRWEGHLGPMTAEQQWMAPKNGMMQGFFRLTDAEKTIAIELFTIRESQSGIEFYFRHFSPELEPWEEKEAYHLNLTKSEGSAVILRTQR